MPNTTKARIINIDGTITEVEPKNGKNFTFEEIKPLLGLPNERLLQIVPIRSQRGMILVCDEEGMFNGEKPNPVATFELCRDVLVGPEGIMGNVLICRSNQIK